MIRKILIANRGEIAVRVIRACKDLGIKTVAVYSACDKDSYHVFLADEAVCIGDSEVKESYLKIDNIIQAAKNTNADAIHPGYGFLSESYEFARQVVDNNFIFIGPSLDVLKKINDKNAIKEEISKMGVPIILGQNYSDFLKHPIVGYPIMIKSKFGGGGEGIRLVNNEQEFKKVSIELKKEFCNSKLYVEKYISSYKHIEIQLISDKCGNVSAMPERDCSLQVGFQKIIEETPSTMSDDKLIKELKDTAILIFKELKYDGIGTVEFLVDDKNNYYFLEINGRIQVEHAISEVIADIYLVKEQIRIVDGGKNKFPTYILPKRYAIECRIKAIDTENNFFPSIGRINIFNIPSGNNIRIDTYVYQGYELKPYYDSLIYKVIVYGDTRDTTIRRMYNYLDEFIICGIKTNIDYLQSILNSDELKKGDYGFCSQRG